MGLSTVYRAVHARGALGPNGGSENVDLCSYEG